MPKDNLAYKPESYSDIPDSPLLKKTANQRTAGGVMIKIGKNKRLKINTSAAASSGAKRRVSRGTVLSVVVLSAMAFLVLFRGLMIQSGYDKLEAKNEQLAAIIAENQKIHAAFPFHTVFQTGCRCRSGNRCSRFLRTDCDTRAYFRRIEPSG